MVAQARLMVVVGESADARGRSRDRRKYVPVGCVGAIPGADAPASALARPPTHHEPLWCALERGGTPHEFALRSTEGKPQRKRWAHAIAWAAWLSNGAFESVGARDGAAAAYRDVLAAVSKAPFESRAVSDTGYRQPSWCDAA